MPAAETGQPDQRQDRLDPAPDLAAVADPAGPVGKPEGDIVEDVEVREKGEVLEDEADAALVGLDGKKRAAVEEDIAAVRRLEPGEDAEERRLAGAARPEDGDVLAFLGGEADGTEGLVAPEGLADLTHFEKRRHVPVAVLTEAVLNCRAGRRPCRRDQKR